MDKREIRVIIFSGAVLSIFLFAILYNAFSRKIDVPACVPFNAAFEKPQLKQVDDNTYELFMVAHMWSFTPDDVEIPKGATVDLYLSSKDVVHGFHIVSKDVNLMAVPGAINKTTLHFDESGVYNIVCHEYCGAGHQNMMGRIIVK